jgi:hypothetical protein
VTKRSTEEEFAVLEAPERAVLRKGKPMKARLLKPWGGNYAGQVLSNVQEGSIPADVATFYEDNDPAINTVVEDEDVSDPLAVINGEIDPKAAKDFDEAQRARVKSSQAVNRTAVTAALAEQERKDTQRRAREADDFAAGRTEAAAATLTESQKEATKAGKEHGVKAGTTRTTKK